MKHIPGTQPLTFFTHTLLPKLLYFSVFSPFEWLQILKFTPNIYLEESLFIEAEHSKVCHCNIDSIERVAP